MRWHVSFQLQRHHFDTAKADEHVNRMFMLQRAIEGGRCGRAIGIRTEWFYKCTDFMLQTLFAPLTISPTVSS
jgi:hypothetical protein